MSISSSLYSERANIQKKEWTDELTEILDDKEGDIYIKLDRIALVLLKMKVFQFSE